MKIGIDITGGDYAPKATMQGAWLARQELPDDVGIVLIGSQKDIEATAKKKAIDLDQFIVFDAPGKLRMGDHPIKAFSTKKDSSIVQGFQLLSAGKIDAFCSAGNTGAMLIGATQVINPIPGIIRPGITAPFPSINGKWTVLIDVGINPDCKPDVLYQYAILGSIYSEFVYKIKDPRVALLNIGKEEEKGNLLTKAAYQTMKGSGDFNFVGNIEPNDFFVTDKADVIVCDGFVGNVILKEAESLYHLTKKRGIKDEFLDLYNFEVYGGTPILGINKPVLIGHGISGELAIKNMIMQAKMVTEAQVPEKIRQALKKEAT